jgi:hypothetical protein
MKRLVLVFAAGALTLVPACTTSKSGENMASIHTNMATGNVSTTLPVGLDRAYAAAQNAVQQMQYQVTKQNKDAQTGVINAKTADGIGINVTVHENGANQSNLEVDASPLHTDIAKNLAQKIQSMAK